MGRRGTTTVRSICSTLSTVSPFLVLECATHTGCARDHVTFFFMVYHTWKFVGLLSFSLVSCACGVARRDTRSIVIVIILIIKRILPVYLCILHNTYVQDEEYVTWYISKLVSVDCYLPLVLLSRSILFVFTFVCVLYVYHWFCVAIDLCVML